VVTPTRLNHAETELIKQFASKRPPVAAEFAKFQQGLFAKLRDRFLNI
jgi:molecular chaperone DnaJ